MRPTLAGVRKTAIRYLALLLTFRSRCCSLCRVESGAGVHHILAVLRARHRFAVVSRSVGTGSSGVSFWLVNGLVSCRIAARLGAPARRSDRQAHGRIAPASCQAKCHRRDSEANGRRCASDGGERSGARCSRAGVAGARRPGGTGLSQRTGGAGYRDPFTLTARKPLPARRPCPAISWARQVRSDFNVSVVTHLCVGAVVGRPISCG